MGFSVFPVASSGGATLKQTINASTSNIAVSSILHALVIGAGGGAGSPGLNNNNAGSPGGYGGVAFGASVPGTTAVIGAAGTANGKDNESNVGPAGNAGGVSSFGTIIANGGNGGGGSYFGGGANPAGNQGTPTTGSVLPVFTGYSANAGTPANPGAVYLFY
jgi:hypothetical protein